MMRLYSIVTIVLSVACSSQPEEPKLPHDETGCGLGQLLCNQVCIDPTTNSSHCGACGQACVGSQSCVQQSCQCLAGLSDCGAGCIEVGSNAANCGGCGVACTPDQVCSLGQCTSGCAPGLTACGQSCVDIQTSPVNCGVCNNVCPVGQSCAAGVCSCVSGQTFCGDRCADTLTDVEHCGSCGNQCPVGQLCTGGSCLSTTSSINAASSGTASNGVTSSANGTTGGSGGTAATSTGGATGTNGTMGAGGATTTTATTSGVTSTGGASTTTTTTTTNTSTTGGTGPIDVPFILGADISFVQEEEDKGINFVDGGTQKDILQLLGDHGFNYIRLRLFHNPGASGGYQFEFVTRAEPYCDLAHTVEMAQRVKAAGMGFLLDLHYSDTWADPGNQHKPAAWAGLSFDQLLTAVYDYTRDTLLTFQAAGALPDMVQVGNEITPGMLHPDGHTYEPNNWDQLAQLLNAGLSAVKEVNGNIETMLHIDRGGDNETSVWWVGEALARGVQFDILGQSAYTAFHGDSTVWAANFADLASRYSDLDFVIAEYNGEKRAANDVLRNLPGGRGRGTFFWEPTANGEWGDSMVTWDGSNAVFKPADLAIYDQIADDYDLR